MRYLVLVSDYDGTIATEGRAETAALKAIERLRTSGITVNQALAVLEDPTMNLNVNLLGIPLADRPEYFGRLLPSLQAMRTRAGRPHWIVLDEAHHMLPADWGHVGRASPQRLGETVLVTVHPEHVAPLTLSLIDIVIAVGPSPDKTLNSFAAAAGQTVTWPAGLSHQSGHVVVWFSRSEKNRFSCESCRVALSAFVISESMLRVTCGTIAFTFADRRAAIVSGRRTS